MEKIKNISLISRVRQAQGKARRLGKERSKGDKINARTVYRSMYSHRASNYKEISVSASDASRLTHKSLGGEASGKER
jgi:hypothetical protein